VSLTVNHRNRRFSSFGASLALFIGALVVASPAQAAVGVDLSVNAGASATITEGDSVTLSWTSTEAVDLVASGSWSGNKTAPAGTEVVTPTATGDFTYTLLATDMNGRESTDSVTVTVEPAAPVDITPTPVTFPDECTVVVPTTPNVTYYVSYGDGDDQEVDADSYNAAEFYNGDEPVKFYAVAADGFQFADGATTEWDYTASMDCLAQGPTLVTATATCGKVTFTSVFDGTLHVAYGDMNEPQPDGQFDLAAGASHTVTTSRELVFYVAVGDSEESIQIDFVDVPQDCGGAGAGNGNVSDSGDSDHPTVAPEAGVSESGDGSSLPALALLGLVSVALAHGLRRTVR
jgi:hypothetical protein